MSGSFGIRTGAPFTGIELELIKEFLAYERLDYEEGIEYTVIMEDGNRIIGTGSCQGNVMKCFAIAKDCQGMGVLSQIIMSLVYYLVQRGISHYFIFTKPKNRKIFEDMSFHELAMTEDVLLMENKKNGIQNFLRQLQKQSAQITNGVYEMAGNNGAVVANCNPFTLGHKYLMETAAVQCEWLNVFILSQNNQMFSEQERFQMVREGTSHIPNIIIYKASDYLISPATFPTYFMKDREQPGKANYILDLTIFCKHIVPALGIKKRFAGTEPYCKITGQYNECMRLFLPRNGVEFIEIERLRQERTAISATNVRKKLSCKELDGIKDLVPASIVRYLER